MYIRLAYRHNEATSPTEGRSAESVKGTQPNRLGIMTILLPAGIINVLGRTTNTEQFFYCCMTRAERKQNWTVRIEDTTVVVKLPDGIELDQETGQRINEQFFDAVEQPHVDSVLTLLRVEDPLSSGLFEEVQRGADRAAAAGVVRWAIHVETRIKGMAFESKLDDLDTEVFEDEQSAREWVET
jgi:hypothetical protein